MGEKVEENEIFDEAFRQWGEPAQLMMFLEESSELNHAICAYLRGREGAIDGIIDELADVDIMVCQLKVLFGGNADIGTRRKKMERLAERLKFEPRSGGEKR